MEPDKEKALEEAYQKVFMISTNQIPLDGVKEFVASDIMGFGTTVDEKVSGLNQFKTFVKGQEVEAAAAGLDFKFEPKRVHRRISPNEAAAMFIEEVMVTLRSGETIVQQFSFRLSCHMELIKGRWMLVHFHGSAPVQTENDTWHIDHHKKEKERLEKEVQERTKELEKAIHELKATQEQLIQQEKLASLGQLTAGIAHEIKNPLNFVNNFSELSVELIDEAKEELSAFSDQLSAKDREKVEESLEILKDIDMNLRKINEHGTRADRIVKSMLQHSRSGDSTPEPTDLNILIKEYVNLSFHGMRASNDPINVDLQFKLDESIGEVPLIAEGFSRVIVNLCNNGFDAMKEKLSAFSDQSSASYKAKLTVRTKLENGNVVVEIEDNGSGIPEEIKDKIMQPFFTTKKGTEGTGLGLSITNDIIKAHGGSLEIKNQNNAGTLCRITIKTD